MYTKVWQRLWCDYLGKQTWRARDTESQFVFLGQVSSFGSCILVDLILGLWFCFLFFRCHLAGVPSTGRQSRMSEWQDFSAPVNLLQNSRSPHRVRWASKEAVHLFSRLYCLKSCFPTVPACSNTTATVTTVVSTLLMQWSQFRVDHSENLLLTNTRYFYWVLFGLRPLFARTWPIWSWSPVHMALVTSKLTCNICTREQEKRMKESCSSSRTIRLQMRSSLSSSMICWLLVPWTCACQNLWIATHCIS